jgi:hypothetical protein
VSKTIEKHWGRGKKMKDFKDNYNLGEGGRGQKKKGSQKGKRTRAQSVWQCTIKAKMKFSRKALNNLKGF